jgi:hypothetical protein
MDYYITAEKICRQEYEKQFNLDLSLPYGHPKNIFIYTSHEEHLEKIKEQIVFWRDFGYKYTELDGNTPSRELYFAIQWLCQLHMIRWLQRLQEAKSNK